MQPTDDGALLRQYSENNSDEAFAALVTRHINLVYSVALRQVGDAHAAEEITQAVFIILAKKAAQLRNDKALASWLFQAARLTANNFIRSESRRHRREEEAYMQSVLNETGAEVWPRIAPLLDDAVANLREQDRRAIVLRYYEGRNLREVGAALGAGEMAAEKRVNRALEKLRKFFAKHGVSLTTAILAGTISANSVQAAPVALAKAVTAIAVAKGAAASASTLTLIKGALKIMAWTKAKTVVIVGVVSLLALGTASVAFNARNSQSGSSKVAVSLLNTTNIDGSLFYQFSFVNRDRKPIRWRGFWSEVEGNANELAPIQNRNHPWGFSAGLLEPGGSVVSLVGAPSEPGKWRFCVTFTPNATANIWDGLTNTLTTKSPWLSGKR